MSKEAQNDVREADQNLDQMSGALKNLQRIAVTMGRELDDHNTRLDEVDKGVNYANIKVKEGNQKIDKILK